MNAAPGKHLAGMPLVLLDTKKRNPAGALVAAKARAVGNSQRVNRSWLNGDVLSTRCIDDHSILGWL